MTEVHTTPHTHDSGSGSGFLMGMILLVVLFLLFFYYGLPAIRNATTSPQINVPGQIDVNVNQGEGGK